MRAPAGGRVPKGPRLPPSSYIKHLTLSQFITHFNSSSRSKPQKPENFSRYYKRSSALSAVSSQHSAPFRPGMLADLKTGFLPAFRCLVKSSSTLKAILPRSRMTTRLIMAISPMNRSAISQTICTFATAPKKTIASTST